MWPKIFLVLRNNAYMPYISSTLDGKRQTIIQDPLLHTSLLDSLNSLVVNDEDYSLKLDRNEYFLFISINTYVVIIYILDLDLL